MKPDDRDLAVSDVEDGGTISSPDPKPKGHPRDPVPKEPLQRVSVSASNVGVPFKLNFASTNWPYRMIIPSHQITASNMKKSLNAPSRKIIKANPRGRG